MGFSKHHWVGYSHSLSRHADQVCFADIHSHNYGPDGLDDAKYRRAPVSKRIHCRDLDVPASGALDENL